MVKGTVVGKRTGVRVVLSKEKKEAIIADVGELKLTAEVLHRHNLKYYPRKSWNDKEVESLSSMWAEETVKLEPMSAKYRCSD